MMGTPGWDNWGAARHGGLTKAQVWTEVGPHSAAVVVQKQPAARAIASATPTMITTYRQFVR
jgi:hypothetical protein